MFNRKRGKLRKLVVDRVDLVDAGANPDADVVLFKRDTAKAHTYEAGPGGDCKTCGMAEAMHKTQKSEGDTPEPTEDAPVADTPTVEDLQKQIDDIQAERDAAKAELDALAKMAPADVAALLGIEVAKADEPETEDVTKGMTPEAAEVHRQEVAKREALEQRVAKMEADSRRADFVAKAKAEYEQVPASNDEVADLLATVEDAGNAEVTKTLNRVLKAFGEQVDITKEIGRSQGADNDEMGQLKAIADELRKADPSLTPEVALAKAVAANLDLAAKAHSAK